MNRLENIRMTKIDGGVESRRIRVVSCRVACMRTLRGFWAQQVGATTTATIAIAATVTQRQATISYKYLVERPWSGALTDGSAKW